MKNRIIVASVGIISISLMAFGYSNWNETPSKKCSSLKTEHFPQFNYYFQASNIDEDYTDFFYDMGTRFQGIKKSTTLNATTLADMVEKQDLDKVESYKRVSLIIVKNDEQTDIREIGYSDKLTESQLKLLRSFDYSTNFVIRAEFVPKSKKSPEDYNYFSPHMTVVPEKQAEYVDGKDALLIYFSARNKKNTKNLDIKLLQPAKMYFTVTKEGKLTNIRLDRSCGYSNIDIDMIELLTNSEGKWLPAQNAEGQKVDQELVVSYGMVGC